MTIARRLSPVLLLILAATVFAQNASSTPEAKGQASQAATAAPAAPTFASMVDRQMSSIEKLVVEAAEAMPEDKYNFSPESLKITGSDYKGVRTFALEVRHIATANYAFWSALTGDPMPAGIKGPNGPEDLKTKAEIVKFLKDSYALGHKAAATLTSANALEPVAFPMGKAPRLQLATQGVGHAYDHYGQMVEYLRMNGVVPPASRTNQ